MLTRAHPEYEHKELIFLPTPQWEDDSVETNMLEDTIPDALLYDTVDETYTTIYYKYVWETNFEHFESSHFCSKYNNTIHLMIIISANQEYCQTIYDIIKQHKCEFDVRIQTQYNNVEEYTGLVVDDQTLKKIDELDVEFMAEEGEQVRQLFYREYYYKYYYKFKYDHKFVTEFYEFVKTYTTKNDIWVCIDGEKSKELKT